MNQSPDFKNFSLSSGLLEVLTSLGYQKPTPIQHLSLALLLSGKDLIGQSKTGSGKTAAFSIPMLEKLDTTVRATTVLILCPTRELCTQITKEVRRLGRYKKDLRVAAVYGGEPIYLQLKALKTGAHIVVGTPGRLKDHCERNSLDLSTVDTLVLDEADRMLEMGFRDQIEWILGKVPKERQTSLFSATFPETIETLSRRYMKSPSFVQVEDTDDKPMIEQHFYLVDHHYRTDALRKVLLGFKFQSCLVFCNRKLQVDEVAVSLGQFGYSVEKIHGDLVQADRDRVITKFRNGSVTILVATDVAARGLDIKELDIVVNYELPGDAAVFVHRIGRTGRAGAKGVALTLTTAIERRKVEAIEETFQTKIVFKSIPQAKAEGKLHPKPQAAMETLYISGGRKDKVRPGDILGALTGESGGLKGDLIGKIEILDHHSYVAIQKTHSRQALKALQGGKIKGRRFMVQLVS